MSDRNVHFSNAANSARGIDTPSTSPSFSSTGAKRTPQEKAERKEARKEKYRANPERYYTAPMTDAQKAAAKEKRNAARSKTQAKHAAVAPVKETLRKNGLNWAQLSGHMQRNAATLGNTKTRRLAAIIDMHSNRPEDFDKVMSTIKATGGYRGETPEEALNRQNQRGK
jgi:hypothetical protein